MHIDGLDSYFQTILFTVFLIAATLFTAKRDSGPHEMNQTHTSELKGIAILMVIFSHIGYFLFSDHKFLFPFSVAGGVGVNIFLFLSGFGLTSSALKTNISIIEFYAKRLINIFIPMWLVLIPILLIDYNKFGKSYSISTVLQSIVGIFPNADIDTAINSPLWYFTLILFYYLIFPLVYRRKRPILSIITVLLIGLLAVNIKIPFSSDVIKLYQLHCLAFPLGMAFAHLDKGKFGVRINNLVISLSTNKTLIYFYRYSLIFLLTILLWFTCINSSVGEGIIVEQLSSLVSVSILVTIFLLKDIQSGLLITLGKYSYEIYLIQWPLMYRYDLIYKHTPPFLGTILYILVFLCIGYILNNVSKVLILSLKKR